MLKAVTLFLVVIAVFAMFGKLGWLGRQIGIKPRGDKIARPRSCKRCGRFIIGKGDCDCGLPPADNGDDNS